MSRLFEGKVALITGGNAGIGRATALAFAEQGANVVIAARRVSEGEATVKMIKVAGGEAVFIRTDISIASDVEQMVDRTVKTYGKLDCAFNNAGIGGGSGPIHESSEKDWDSVMAVNLRGTWLCLKYEIRQMLKQMGGAIVNNSSAAGLRGFERNPIYSASKHGVIGLTKSVAAQYFKAGIRVNAVCPGVIATEMTQWVDESVLKRQPVGRLGLPEEVAETVMWLCSDKASYIAGQALPVDGSWLSRVPYLDTFNEENP